MRKSLLSILIFLFSLAGYNQTITVSIDPGKTAQTIDNIGASGAWFSEGIGRFWPAAKKERMAELLFSKAFDSSGNPLGIGLSAFRFNIGGGTAEQGDSSGIRDPIRRVECFRSPDGSYDWTKQAGYMWFVRKAAHYKVENLIAFSNTPPVQFTKNGLGFKLEKNYETNLRDDNYGAYADFLATVIQHFHKEGLHFGYISPVNEPQWDWSNRFGQMNQEGSPWHNKDIFRITVALDSALQKKRLNSRILLPEAAVLTSLYGDNTHASRQIQTFYNQASPFYIGNLKRVLPVVAGHSYFTDNGDSSIISVRAQLKDTASKYGVPFWQSEYSMLGDGYKQRKKERIPAMDCALFLAKMIHYDFTVADASAWQFWNAWEPGRADFDTRYYLIALKINQNNTDGNFTPVKNLWALGHYSRFIRPGMKRIATASSEGKSSPQNVQEVLLSAFGGKGELVVVAVNQANKAKEVVLKIAGRKKMKEFRQFVTTGSTEDNMRLYSVLPKENIILQPRSITTLVIKY